MTDTHKNQPLVTDTKYNYIKTLSVQCAEVSVLICLPFGVRVTKSWYSLLLRVAIRGHIWDAPKLHQRPVRMRATLVRQLRFWCVCAHLPCLFSARGQKPRWDQAKNSIKKANVVFGSVCWREGFHKTSAITFSVDTHVWSFTARQPMGQFELRMGTQTQVHISSERERAGSIRFQYDWWKTKSAMFATWLAVGSPASHLLSPASMCPSVWPVVVAAARSASVSKSSCIIHTLVFSLRWNYRAPSTSDWLVGICRCVFPSGTSTDLTTDFVGCLVGGGLVWVVELCKRFLLELFVYFFYSL